MFRAFLFCLFSGVYLLSFSQNDRLDSLYTNWDKIVEDSIKVDFLNEIAYEFIGIDPNVSRDSVIAAYKLATSIEYKRGEARSLAVMGGVYWGLGDYQEALAHYLDALKVYQELDDMLGRSICLNNIGEVYKKLGQYNNSLDYLLHSLAIKEELEGIGAPALSYNNLAELYTLMGDYELAHEFFEKAEIASRKKPIRVQAYVEDGWGSLYFVQNDYKNALEKFRLSVVQRTRINDNRGLAYSYNHIGKVYAELDRIDSAYYYYSLALKYANKSRATDIRLNLYNNLSGIDSLQRDYRGAYTYFLKYANLKDSIFSLKKETQIARIEAEYQNELLSRKNEVRTTQLKQRNTLIIVAVMFIILLGILAYTLYVQRQKQKLANRILSEKNEQIHDQNEEINYQSDRLKELNVNLASLNKNLEKKILERTEELEQRNLELAEYAFIHAHELRAPIANILGLVELLQKAELGDNDRMIIDHLLNATKQLDNTIKSIISKEEPATK